MTQRVSLSDSAQTPLGMLLEVHQVRREGEGDQSKGASGIPNDGSAFQQSRSPRFQG